MQIITINISNTLHILYRIKRVSSRHNVNIYNVFVLDLTEK